MDVLGISKKQSLCTRLVIITTEERERGGEPGLRAAEQKQGGPYVTSLVIAPVCQGLNSAHCVNLTGEVGRSKTGADF